MKFIDNIHLRFKAGQGGAGIVSFFQDWMQAKPRADGGNGGNGGDIILQSDEKVNSFANFRPNQLISAQPGENGKRAKKHGKNGKKVILYVPVGTIVFSEDKKEILFNFEKNNQSFVVAKGGIGGFGNAFFMTNNNKKSYHAQPGTLGEIKNVWLELKIIAKVGIIGLPNAGKSSLLSALTNANPQIANYQFTTIIPNLGVLTNSKHKKILIADLPGIVEGASQNRGLGNQFLKHIERCYLLIHLIDFNVENLTKLEQNFNLINKELISYNQYFAKTPQIVVGNKIDLKQSQARLKELKANSQTFWKHDFIEISAKENINLNLLIAKIFAFFSKPSKLTTVMEKTILKNNKQRFVYHHSLESEIRLRKLKKGIWELSGKLIRKLWERYDVNNEQDLKKFNEHFKQDLIYKCLKDHGIKDGDIIFVYGHQFEWKY